MTVEFTADGKVKIQIASYPEIECSYTYADGKITIVGSIADTSAMSEIEVTLTASSEGGSLGIKVYYWDEAMSEYFSRTCSSLTKA